MAGFFRPRLINGRFGDAALFVALAHQREAVLFDLGDIAQLGGRDMLRVRTVAVSHMHIDHLIGFDTLLRANVGREARIKLFGPDGLADRIGHKLQGYTWDLVERYATELVFEVGDLVAADRVRLLRFRLSRRFAAEPLGEVSAADGLLEQTATWRLRARIVAHHGPCLAFALEEAQRINVWRNRVEAAGLPLGPWLNRLKQAIREGAPGDTPIPLPGGGAASLAGLRHLVDTATGMKLGYATDVRDTPANRAALAELCRDADILFIEAAFAAAEAARADDRAHLTTTAAGEIARACGARRVEPFHFSPRYQDAEDERLAEVRAAFAGARAPAAEPPPAPPIASTTPGRGAGAGEDEAMTDDKPNLKTGMENARTADPLERNDANPSANSRLHAATAIQSDTTPEAYPKFEREAQVEQATGRPAPKKREAD